MDLTLAVGTDFNGDLRFLFISFPAQGGDDIHRLDQQEDGECHNDEIDHGSEKGTIAYRYVQNRELQGAQIRIGDEADEG